MTKHATIEALMRSVQRDGRVFAEMNRAEAQEALTLIANDIEAGTTSDYDIYAICGISYALGNDGENFSIPKALAEDLRRCLNQIKNTKVYGLSQGADTYSVVARLDTILGFPGGKQ